MTASRTAALGGNVVAGTGRPLTLIGGPCVIESEALVMEVAERLVDITSRLGIQYVFVEFRQGEPYVEFLLPWTGC